MMYKTMMYEVESKKYMSTDMGAGFTWVWFRDCGSAAYLTELRMVPGLDFAW